MIATFQREIDRAAAFQARLDAIDASLSRLIHGPRADQRARHLLFGILEELLMRFALAHAGNMYAAPLADVAALLAEGRAIAERAGAFWPERLLETRVRADALASRIFARAGAGGSWPLELQIPFDLATLLRRACEQRAEELLPLALLDVFRLLDVTKRRHDPEPIEHLIAKANGGAWQRPEEPSEPVEPPRALAPEVYEEDTADEPDGAGLADVDDDGPTSGGGR